MIERNELYNRILFLVPDAKFSFWPDDDRQLNWTDENVDYVKRDGWCIAWLKSNGATCPELSAINAVSAETLVAAQEVIRKNIRNSRMANSLTMKACFNLAKIENPELIFSDYLDSLENNPPVI